VTSPIISDPATSVDGNTSAIIIAFPVRPKPVTPEERLARALEKLNAAMLEQRAAVGRWHTALGELKATTGELGNSLQRYRTSLDSLGKGVSALQTKARSLEEWADTVAAE
jgi:hypothetical protein